MSEQIPLFPLQTVLFPGASLSLHIFEERYRLMIGRCLAESAPFGVVLIRSGSEVSYDDPWARRMREAAGPETLRPGETIPYPVGTTALVTDNVRLDDGRYYLVAAGQRRFRIQHIAQRQPYLVASVAYLDEPRSTATSEAARRVRELYMRYWATVSAATGQEHEPEPLPDDAAELAYALAHRLRVNNARKQRWLEGDTAMRLREIGATLRAELALLPAGGPPEDASAGPWSWN